MTKPDSRRLGISGERAVRWYYFFRGYRCLARNYRAGHCELDLVVSGHKTLVFVEVKTRTVRPGMNFMPTPASAVGKEKKRHLLMAARRYLSAHPTTHKIRFDVAEVLETEKNGRIHRQIHIIKDAFSA